MHDLYEIAVCVCVCAISHGDCVGWACVHVHACARLLCPCEVTRLQMFIVALALLAMGAVDKHARCSVLLTEHALERRAPQDR